jgi:protoheme IX farnesyltransferase
VRGRPGLAADLASLAKLRISLLSTLSAATGFVAAARELRAPILSTLAGTFLLAAAAAALNELLDRDRDARMERTRERPIPAGRIGASAALLLALLSGAAGAALLWLGAGLLPALLGLGALLWYDAVYTPLKRLTAFAVLPGALVGALPPAIGWTAAGGGLADIRLHALCAFFLLWQVPHFWLLALRHAEDFARGGFPTPAHRFSPAQVGRITFVWTLATAASALLLPLFGITRSGWGAFGLVAAASALLPSAWRLLRAPERAGRAAAAFLAVNLLAVAVMAIALADALLGR